MSEQNSLKVAEINKTYVYGAVRCVGTLKPVFDAQQNGFLPPELTVAGQDFGLRILAALLHALMLLINIWDGRLMNLGC